VAVVDARRAAWMKRALSSPVRFVCVAFALSVPAAGCGSTSGDDSAKVEVSMRSYLGATNPEHSSFPVGAGVPRVGNNACKDGHVTIKKGKLLSDAAGIWRARFPEDVALWSCVVTFGSLARPATVAVTARTRVVWAVALPLDAFPAGQLTHTYGGITCLWPRATPDGVAICQLATGTGIGVAVAGRSVVVFTQGRPGKRLFVRNQSVHSPAMAPLNDKRIVHSETHRGIVCYWSKTRGAIAVCNRADRHGYLAGVSKSTAVVLNDQGEIVFQRKHS
jgi:hypothetical protein